ncbi:aldose 1-epimerase family protein [Lacticaseibacillus daqingensis]|uniref:aldose 1-epimerase family protein n=1 Tax=Lacticaseibacillus daqingensis TaxID=2486014 RepID=UPI000F7B9CA1|nr:aldose 1-epimerase family protein [Lacticaseibacillus daqingensis]
MVTLHNDFLTVTVAEHGAEITSIQDNHTQTEYIWQADPAVWKRHAPVLFPIVGALKDDTYTYNGKRYHMTQHGFARDRDFTVAIATATVATLVLTDDESSRAIFPFAFRFEVIVALENNSVKVTYHVTNPDEEEALLFSVGGHPGFNIPLTADTTFTDYYMAFSPRKSRVQIPLKAGAGIDYKNRTLAATDTNLQLSHDYFKNDAVIFELNGKSTFAIRSDKTKRGVELSVADAPFVGVWSPYPTTGEFVCIEPWWGIADTIDATGRLEDKLGINTLAPGEDFAHSYTITIH